MSIVNSGVGIAVQNAVNGPLSRAGQILVDPAGLAQYLIDNVVIFQDLRAGACLSTIDVVTLQQQVAVAPGGCNILVAGAGVWAAWGAGGYRDAYGTIAPTWVPLAVDQVTGEILVLVQNGYASTINWWDGTTLSVPLYIGAPPGNGAAAGAEHGLAAVEFAARPVFFPAQSWPSMPIRDFSMQDGWISGWSWIYNGLAAWKCGPSPLGYLLSVNIDQFASDVALLDSGIVRVVASSGAGQLPNELVTYDIDPVAQTINGTPVSLVDLTQVAQPPIEPPTPVPPTPIPPIPVPPIPVPPIPPPIPVPEAAMLSFVVGRSALQPYHEWPTTHVVITAPDGRFLVVNRTDSSADLKWVTGANTPTGGILSGEAWQRQPNGTLTAERNGLTLVIGVDPAR